MPNSEDRRVKMTKKILKEALIDIMKTKPIHDISIKKICDIADVNRSTFYHHYQSPIELYNDIINDVSIDITVMVDKHRERKSKNADVIAEILSYVESNKELFLILLSDRGNITIGERLSGIINSFLGADIDSELSMYCAQFISAGVANILWLWLNKENRLPPKDVAALITAIMSHGVKRAMMFTSKDSLFSLTN